MKKLITIAAVGKNNELGKDNDLIWHIKGDMKFFKEHTINHHIVMGKNTFYSLPFVLPKRTHIVLSRNNLELPEGVILLHSIDEFLEYSKNIDDDFYIVGGATLYKETLDKVDEMLITKIDDSCNNADVYFPNISSKYFDEEVLEENYDNFPSYKHILYKRKTDK